MEAQVAVHGPGLVVVDQLERSLHRLQERFSVELDGVRAANRAPQTTLRIRGLDVLECALEVAQRLVDVAATNCEVGGALEPGRSLCPQPCQLLLVAAPGEIGIFGARRFGEMMGQQRRVLVAAAAEALEPARERRMQPRTPRFGNAPVCDLPGDGVLDSIL